MLPLLFFGLIFGVPGFNLLTNEEKRSSGRTTGGWILMGLFGFAAFGVLAGGIG